MYIIYHFAFIICCEKRRFIHLDQHFVDSFGHVESFCFHFVLRETLNHLEQHNFHRLMCIMNYLVIQLIFSFTCVTSILNFFKTSTTTAALGWRREDARIEHLRSSIEWFLTIFLKMAIENKCVRFVLLKIVLAFRLLICYDFDLDSDLSFVIFRLNFTAQRTDKLKTITTIDFGQHVKQFCVNWRTKIDFENCGVVGD